MIKKVKPVIRFATLDDAKAIAKVHILSWQASYKAFIPKSILQALSVKERTQQWQDLMKQDVKILIVEVEQNIAGFVSMCMLRDIYPSPLNGEISALYLHPTYWRLGLGTKLCQAAFSELAKMHYQYAYVWVLSDNHQACHFYEALGFENTTITKLEEFYENGALLKEILYKKKI
ncbi:GNAT family N-acetyltransferase [Legionella gresilensis]|uniref:GNAT family N-acetyltransferase n=1 Tax=Legionella gresilensis TaxID=91823 RepID=UPI0010416756|nr:GNAT family N-acetyltransferase [Legionella gresilensis]